MRQIIECVPNFSEGRDANIIESIAESIRNVSGVKLLSVEPDKDYNRSVVTFIGEPEAVKEAAFRSTKTASLLIDMAIHKGEHPRIGAVDVVPFVPVSGVSMDDCIRLANDYGSRVAGELGIPVFLYEEAARTPERRNLANVRKGEYEALPEKLRDPAWKPDYGDPLFNPKSGATVTGARMFLIAYNVNLTTNDKDIAHEIALRIRESGRIKTDPSGNKIKIPGTLRSVKAMGVFLDRFGIAQVSINLTNFNVTPPHVAFEEVRKEARTLGINVTGSEIVGLIPKAALVAAGKFYARDAGGADESLYIARAIEALGLSQLERFDPGKKIIEYMI